MQRLIVAFLLTIFINVDILSQVTSTIYENEWIDFEQTYYKVKLSQTGLYRINQPALQSAGINAKGADLKMYYKGKEVPIYVTNQEVLGAQDYVEFFGEKNNGELDTRLFQKPEWQLSTVNSLFSDTSAYFLTAEVGGSHLRYETVENDLSNPPSKETFYMRRSENTFRNIHIPGKRIRIGGTSVPFADFHDSEGFSSNGFFNDTNTYTKDIETPSVFFNGGEATVETKLIGLNNDPFTFNDHPASVSFNNTVYLETNFEGYDGVKEIFNVPVGELTEENTEVIFTSLPPPNETATNNYSAAYVHITYPSTFDFGGDRNRVFEIDNNGDKYIEVTNFNGGTQPLVYDVTHQQRIIPVVEGETYRFLLKRVEGGADKRKILLTNTSSSISTHRINQVEVVQFTDFSQATNRGDYIIISHPSLRQGAVDQVARYQAHRTSEAGGGHQVAIANIEELYDQFSWGVRKHPLAVRHFVNYIVDKWGGEAEQLLLLGKSIDYRNTTTPTTFGDCLIPTYGHSGSDIMLAARNSFSYINQLALGRVPALTPEEVRIYLDKIIEYENVPDPCQAEQVLWRKHALHIVGGTNLAEAADFEETLSIYEQMYEGYNFGGRVVHIYNKFSDSPIEEADLSNFINPGLGMINFVGHGTGNALNVNIDALEQENFGRYPFILASSCFVGDIHNTANSSGMPEEFIFAPNLGSIGFLAASAIGFPVLLDQYVEGIYRNFTNELYNSSIGLAIRKNTIQLGQEFSDPTSPFFNGVKFNAIFFTLAGDPAVVLNPYPDPEYRVTESGISFEPPQITTDLDSFAVNIVLQNLGKAIEQDIQVVLNHRLPDGTDNVVFSKNVPAPKYADTLQVYVQIGNPDLFGGSNVFEVNIDAQNTVEEGCENNNTTFKEITIFSNQIIPVFPCEFSIVTGPNIMLRASTGQPILEEFEYDFQIDTTALFNSPLLQSTLIRSKAGAVEWQPTINYQDQVVYYWRASQVPDDSNEDPSWATSSFVYEADGSNGWNQSHFYQFNRNNFDDLLLEEGSHRFNYGFVKNQLRVVNNRTNPDNISVSLNGNVLHDFNTSLSTRASCLEEGECEGGFAFVVFKPTPILEPIVASADERTGPLDCGGTGEYGNNHCEFNDLYAIEFSTSNERPHINEMVTFMNETIEEGDYVLIYSVLRHRLTNASPTDAISEHVDFIEDFIKGMGISSLFGLNNNRGFVAFGRKGMANYPGIIQVTSGNLTDTDLEVEVEIDVRADNGRISSLPIGPAKNWQSISWLKDNMPNDQSTLKVYGIGENATDLIVSGLAVGDDIDISNNIDAVKYPFMRLELESSDPTDRTPPQLEYWKINFEGVGELALDTKTAFSFESDTLFEGQTASLSFAYSNVSNVDMDSVLVNYTLVNRNNVSSLLEGVRYAPLKSGENYTTDFSFETTGLGGNNFLLVELNPNNDQLEKRDFNNVLVLPFTILSDRVNPIVDVTFDGRHIVDGDIVSAEPSILIRIKDDNPFFALNDTSDYEIVLTYPDANGTPISEQTIAFNDPMVTFRPATQAQAEAGENTAEIELQPTFAQNGTYEITIQAKDRSGNDFAKKAYKSSFMVITESMISNVLNYPNPFTSSTRFLFTLTGAEIPELIKIQIMTISGKVVREITEAELGNIHIGENLTEFAWDGTDEFGDDLANGVYLYRVISRLNGQNMEQLITNEVVDGSFKNGWGKMYLMR